MTSFQGIDDTNQLKAHQKHFWSLSFFPRFVKKEGPTGFEKEIESIKILWQIQPGASLGPTWD